MQSLFRLLELEKKIEKIQAKTRKYTHRGRPTKNARKLEQLTLVMSYYYENLKAMEDSLTEDEKGRNKSDEIV